MWISKRQIVSAICISLALSIFPRVSAAGTFRDDFDDGDMIGWKPNAATGISIVEGKLQFKGADALIVKVGEPTWKGYSLEAQLKIAGPMGAGWFSVRVMQGNAGQLDGYYEIRLSKTGTIAALYVNGRRLESFWVPIPVEENAWHRMTITPSNGKVSFYLDDVLIAQLTDMELSGYVDMCSTKGTHVYVDNVTISGPNIPDTGPSGPNSFSAESRSKLATTWVQVKRSEGL